MGTGDSLKEIGVTALLNRAAEGDEAARNELYPRIYEEMRTLAAAHLARERPEHTLQPTALLHEAYLRLIEIREIDWISRGHFFAISAKIMRRILISHARARLSAKRGGDRMRVELDGVSAIGPEPESMIVALDEALSRLEKQSPRAYQLVELKFFAGLSFEEAALAMNVSSRTLKRDWELAKRWLYRELQRDVVPSGPEFL
jgi:RNA polymerase sigma factor (TIGR02999 family)